MTLDELKQKIDGHLGLVSEVANGDFSKTDAKFIYKSPTGIILFEINVGDYGDGWQFGGHSGAINSEWKTLCRIHKD